MFLTLSDDLQQVYDVCMQGYPDYTNPYACSIAYKHGQQALVDSKVANIELNKAAPPQCAGLNSLILADFEDAIGLMGNNYGDTTSAAYRATDANTIFIAREYTVKYQPGNCH